ncbi:hypothetical protein G9P44_006141 [Scheffersomyces stipitis]|nr:hypothetical protein G9P44_006141 [Scheffersomyces stipitis]
MDPNNLNPQEVELREQDRWLPIANVARLMKNTLPTTAKVSKDAKECMQECVSEFISFITSEASDKCLREKRKTINGEDILYSMHDLGFENYAEVLKIYLAKYREQQALRQERGESRTSKRQQKQAAAAAAAAAAEAAASEAASTEDIDESEHMEYQEDGTGSNSPSQNGDLNGEHYIENEETYQNGHEDQENEEVEAVEDVVATETQQQEHNEVDSNSVTHVNSALGSNSSSTSSIASPEPYFNHYENNENENENEQDNSKPDQPNTEETEQSELDVVVPLKEGEEYGYDDFITDEPHDELHISETSSHNHIEELAKQLTHDEPDIDTLTAGITNGTANNGFF